MLIEIAKDNKGNLLWEKEYSFKRLFAVGQEQIVDSKKYITVSCKKIDDKIFTVLKAV